MKTKFLNIFFEVLNELPTLFSGLWVRETMQEKMLRLGGINPSALSKGLQNLQYRRMVERNNKEYLITSKGIDWFFVIKFRKLSIKKTKWDNKWRLVIFDVPESMKKQRNLLRSKLKSLNFYPLQKSVFVCPFPCEREIIFMSDYLKITDYVDLIVANSIGRQEYAMKRNFNL